MPLATKNNAIIVKDGRLAENCGCCGGWYCDGLQCGMCRLSTFPPVCSANWDASCTPQNGCKTVYSAAPCSPVTYAASLSGFGETVFDFCNPSTQLTTTFSACNKTYSTNELCGYISVQEQVQQSYELPWLLNAAWHVHTVVNLRAGLTGRLSSGASTSPGNVVFRVLLNAQVRYQESFTFIDWNLSGTHESSPLAIDSLPASGSWLSGRSAAISMTGTYGTISGVRCTIAPQDVTVSFS